MGTKIDDNPFDELPESLVEEMLNQCPELSQNLSNSFQKLFKEKERIRQKLKDTQMLKRDTEITSLPTHPTSCGVDGSYAIEKLLATDMVAFAAVAVEGLTPPSDKRYWPKPHHFSNVLTATHSDATTVVARATMICMELELAAQAPHDVIYLDNSLTTPFIYLNQALNRVEEVSKNLHELFLRALKSGLESYKQILRSQRTDKIYAGLPKYTTRKEITQDILGLPEYEDRGVLSFVLDAGEFSGPIHMQTQGKWHIDRQPVELRSLISDIIEGLDSLHVIYYRPYDYFPALRMEVSQPVAANKHRLGVLFESIKIQCGAPGIIEPYPLYLADRMVKHLRTALPAIRKTTTQEMSLKWDESLGNMYLAMHGYRTEWSK